jgi:hypothetical protein
LFLDGHASHVTLWVLEYADSQRILIIQLMAHSSHISQPPKLCALGMFKFLDKKKKVKKMKGETSKMYRAITTSDNATIIPVV